MAAGCGSQAGSGSSIDGGDASTQDSHKAQTDAPDNGASDTSGEDTFRVDSNVADTHAVTPVTGPCDIYSAANAPCIAAHSTVRALFGNYSGNLYQVQRALDNATKEIGVLSPGGFANSADQDAFCSGTTCTISVIYDQSPMGNHLKPGPAGSAPQSGKQGNTPDLPANATALPLTVVGGLKVYGVLVTPGDQNTGAPGVGYRNDSPKGTATGNKPETEYFVTSGTSNLVGGCCFDYGNAETDNNDDGAGTMEAVYFGYNNWWGSGSGNGPWVMADLENGIWAGGGNDPQKGVSTNTPLPYPYVTAMVIGRGQASFALKGGNAQSGVLTTMYDGPRPNGYTMQLQGAIILGTGGDDSDWAGGNFYEGVMTAGNASDAADDAVQANIVAVAYGTPSTKGYIGCYTDSSARDLPYAAYSNNTTSSDDSCVSACQSAGYKYAGAQDGNQCFCGNSYGSQGTSNNCNMACAGNSGETCGGFWANSVYATGN